MDVRYAAEGAAFGECVKTPEEEDWCPPYVYSVPSTSTPLWNAPTPKSHT